MRSLTKDLNRQTQPLREHRVFNNWRIVAKGFYFAFFSHEIKAGQARSLRLCHQHIVVFRGESGQVYAMDGFCPHMGVDLGIGKVQGDLLRCFFHHWEFNGQGRCAHIPCGETPPKNVQLQTYTVRERYGCIFVWPEAHYPGDVIAFPHIPHEEAVWKIGKRLQRTCHHHINMINGLDPQHLKTVHQLNLDMKLEMNHRSRNILEITLSGLMPQKTWKERLAKKILGKHYAYQMIYADGTIGALTMLKDVKLFNRFPIPPLHMIYAYRPIEHGLTEVQPIYINRKRKGLLGQVISNFQLWLTKTLFYVLRDEDGEVYDNIRFKTESLLKMDLPIARYIGYVNELEPSVWSQQIEATERRF